MWQAQVSLFFFCTGASSKFLASLLTEKKSRRLHLGTLDEVFPGILDYHMKLLSSTFTCTIYFEGFIRKYPFDFFCSLLILPAARSKKINLRLMDG